MSAIAPSHLSFTWSTGNAVSKKKPWKHLQRDSLGWQGCIGQLLEWMRDSESSILIREKEGYRVDNMLKCQEGINMSLDAYESISLIVAEMRGVGSVGINKKSWTLPYVRQSRQSFQVCKSRHESPGLRSVLSGKGYFSNAVTSWDRYPHTYIFK